MNSRCSSLASFGNCNLKGERRKPAQQKRYVILLTVCMVWNPLRAPCYVRHIQFNAAGSDLLAELHALCGILLIESAAQIVIASRLAILAKVTSSGHERRCSQAFLKHMGEGGWGLAMNDVELRGMSFVTSV